MKINDRTYLLRQNLALFEATLNEFSSKSFNLASTNEIIKQSKYNKGSFYYRFKAKEDIYYALIDYVYTTQISIFNDLKIKLSNLTNLEEIILLMFDMMKRLFIIDKRYIDLLNVIYRENNSVKTFIFENCIESLNIRFFKRIKLLINDKYSNKQKKIFLDILNFSCHNPNMDFYSEYDSYVLNLNEYLLKGMKIVQKTEIGKKLDIFDLTLPYIIILANDRDLGVNIDEKVVYLSNSLINQTISLENIRNTLKIQKVSLESIIKSGIKRNLRDFKHLLGLNGIEFYETSYHQLNTIQRIILLTVYFVLLGKEYIVLDYLLKFNSFKEIRFLIKDILPILSKTSRIVVLETEIYLFASVYKNLYFIDQSDNLDRVDITKLHQTELEEVEINYFDDYENLKTEYISKSSPLISEYLVKYKIVNINTMYKICIDDLL